MDYEIYEQLIKHKDINELNEVELKSISELKDEVENYTDILVNYDDSSDYFEIMNNCYFYSSLASLKLLDISDDELEEGLYKFILANIFVNNNYSMYPLLDEHIVKIVNEYNLDFYTLYSLAFDYYITANKTDLAFNCARVALSIKPCGLRGGFALVQFIENTDFLKMILVNTYLDDSSIYFNPLEAAKVLFTVYTDNLAFAHLIDPIENQFELLFEKLVKDEINKGSEEYNYYLGMMYLEGIGTEINLTEARKYLDKVSNDKLDFYDNIIYSKTDYINNIKSINDSNFKIGDIISYGEYNHRKILWQVIGEDDESYKLLSYDVLESSYVANRKRDNYNDIKHIPSEYYSKNYIIDNLPNKDELLITQEYFINTIPKYSFLPKTSDLDSFSSYSFITTQARKQAYINGFDNDGLEHDKETGICNFLCLDDENNELISVDYNGDYVSTNRDYARNGIRPMIYLKKILN